MNQEFAASAVILMSGFDPEIAIKRYPHVDIHRLAAHLAIFYVLLLFQRAVHQDGDQFTAVGATDAGFSQQVHFSANNSAQTFQIQSATKTCVCHIQES